MRVLIFTLLAPSMLLTACGKNVESQEGAIGFLREQGGYLSTGELAIAKDGQSGDRHPIGPDNPVVYAHFENGQVTDARLAYLKWLPELESLKIHSCDQVTDAGLIHLKTLTNLNSLYLSGTKVTDAGLVHLNALPQLQSLTLSGPRITDDGLVHLEGQKRLLILDLGLTKVSDAGLEKLKGLSNLTFLSLIGTQVTDAGVKELQAALPKCRIMK